MVDTAPATARFGDYELLKEIARGGMGVVYQARQVRLNRKVALKMILAGQFAGEAEIKRFHLEAQAAAHLQHPNIVAIHEIGEHEGRHYFSMDYVEGSSLAAVVRSNPLEPTQAARTVRAVAEAIRHAHQCGVIHRDLKPQNILIDATGQPRVTDFGLAKRVEIDSGLTRSGAVMGSPSYMSPEQARAAHGEVGPRSDIYSLGAILYEVLTGRPPFRAETAVETVLQVLEAEAVPPRLLNRRVPLELDAICMKCLEKNPADRYESAQSLAEDLDRFLNGVPVLAVADSGTGTRLMRLLNRQTRHTEVMARWCRIWRWQAVQVFCLFLVTNVLLWMDVRAAWPYAVWWTLGIGSLLAVVWFYRFRAGGPLTQIERQLGQVWCLALGGFVLTGVLNHLLGLPSFTLLPVAVLQCGIAFGCMAAILGGEFYLPAVVLAALSLVLVKVPAFTPILFGATFAISLFVPAWRYERRQREIP